MREQGEKSLDHETLEKAKKELLAKSLGQGFTGDVCGRCGNLAMIRAGTCLTCTVCGSTSGCS